MMRAVMKKLKRQWNKASSSSSRSESYGDGSDDKFSLPTLDDFGPIDSHEQEELVRSLEKSQAQQSYLWRSVFAFLLFCYTAFLIFSIYQQASYPWELRYHAYFMEDVESWIIIAADWIAIFACSMTIIGLLGSSYHKQWLWYSCCIAVLLAVFWLYHMLRLPKFRWDVIWLPFGPLSGVGVCLYVEHMLNESSEEVRKLRGYMYSYKAS